MVESKIAYFIKKLPFPFKKQAIRLLYFKSGRYLQDFIEFKEGHFYGYKINNIYVPSESLGWFVDYNYYQNWVNAVSAYAYKPGKGDVVVDVGAGIGEEVTVFSKMVGAAGKVYSIEANPMVFKVLQKLTALNGLGNVELFNIAINTTDENIPISVDDVTFLSGSVGNTKRESKYVDVQGTRFDTFIDQNKISQIDLLKVNIEGAERFLIDSIGDHLQKIRNVAISCHDFRYEFEKERNPFFKTKSLVEAYLLDNGFKITSQQTSKRYIDDWVYGSR